MEALTDKRDAGSARRRGAVSSGYIKGLAAAWSAVAIAGAVGAEFQSITGGMPIWPATGVAAGIALSRPRTTPAIALALLTARFGNGTPWGVATAWGALTAIAIVLFVSALGHLDREQRGHGGLWFFGLALVTAATTATLATSIGSAIQFVAEDHTTTFTLHWLAGDLLSMLILVPAVQALLERRRRQTGMWIAPKSQQPADAGATLPPIVRAHAGRDPAVDDRARNTPRGLASAVAEITEHPLLADAAYFVWDRATGQVSAQGDALRRTLRSPVEEGWSGDSGHLANVTAICTDWLREAGPETRRALRRAFVGLRRDRNPIDLHLPLSAPDAPDPGVVPYGPSLRLRAWASYRPNGRLTRIHGVIEDLRAAFQVEQARTERVATLEREVDRLQGTIAARAGQDLQIAELLALLRKTLADADSLLGEFDRASESNLAEGLADRTFDVAASIRKALRVTSKLATRNSGSPDRASGPPASREDVPASPASPVSPIRPIGSLARAPRWSRRAISVASLLEEDDA